MLFYFYAVAVYNPYDNLTVRAMIKLEMYANVPVLTKLEPQLSELSKRALFRPGVDEKYNVMYKHLFHDYGDDIKYGNEISKSVKYIYSWINQWQVGYGVVLPSWKNFCSILRAISPGSGKLADQIEAYFDQYSIKQIGRFSEGMCILYCCKDGQCRVVHIVAIRFRCVQYMIYC